MKCACLFMVIFLFPIFTQTQEAAATQGKTVEERDSIAASALKDLEEMGYCVIPEVLSAAEAEVLYTRVWHEFIEKVSPHCKFEDRSNWVGAFPKHNKLGIFAGPAGQTQVMWDLRQDPRILHVFAKIWNTYDLIVSMDGISLMCPVQGQFLFEDSFEGDGGFYCIPKSHLRFSEFAPELERIEAMQIPREEMEKIRNAFLDEFFNVGEDESRDIYCKKHITAPRGSLILWDSRTVHWNQHADINRSYKEHPRVRMVGYLCYVPKARLTEEGKTLRKEAFEKGVSTRHNPDRILGEFEQYLEDSSYSQPEIQLSPLEGSLLGYNDLKTEEKNEELPIDKPKEEDQFSFWNEIFFLCHQIFS